MKVKNLANNCTTQMLYIFSKLVSINNVLGKLDIQIHAHIFAISSTKIIILVPNL